MHISCTFAHVRIRADLFKMPTSLNEPALLLTDAAQSLGNGGEKQIESPTSGSDNVDQMLLICTCQAPYLLLL